MSKSAKRSGEKSDTSMRVCPSMINSDNNSNIYAHLYQIRGGGPNGPSHVVTQTANSLDDLLGASPNPGFDEFLEEVSGIRTVVSTGVYQQIMAWE